MKSFVVLAVLTLTPILSFAGFITCNVGNGEYTLKLKSAYWAQEASIRLFDRSGQIVMYTDISALPSMDPNTMTYVYSPAGLKVEILNMKSYAQYLRGTFQIQKSQSSKSQSLEGKQYEMLCTRFR